MQSSKNTRTLKPHDRVTLPNHPFLSGGVIENIIPGLGFVIKLDEKAPNTYAWETDEVIMFPEDVELAEGENDAGI